MIFFLCVCIVQRLCIVSSPLSFCGVVSYLLMMIENIICSKSKFVVSLGGSLSFFARMSLLITDVCSFKDFRWFITSIFLVFVDSGGDSSSDGKRRRTEPESDDQRPHHNRDRREERESRETSRTSNVSSRKTVQSIVRKEDEDKREARASSGSVKNISSESASESDHEEHPPLVKDTVSAEELSPVGDEEKHSDAEEEEKEEDSGASSPESIENAPAWKRELMEQERLDAERRRAEGEARQSSGEHSEEEYRGDERRSTDGEDEEDAEPRSPVPERSPTPQTPPELRLPPYLPAMQGCRHVGEFQCLNRIEEGTFGVVYRARDKRTNETVALKRLKMEKEKVISIFET